VRLLNHVTDTELAVQLAENICWHAHRGQRQSNDSVRKMLDAVDWKHCQKRGLPALVAMKLAGCWLSSWISVDVSDTYPGTSDYGSRVSEDDLPILKSILNFATSIFKEEDPLALKCMSGPNDQTRFLAHYRRLSNWAEKIREAILHGGDSFDLHLATRLIKDKDAIPISFIRFLAAQDEDSRADKTRQEFRMSLLCDTSARKLEKILPATDEAKKTSKAAALLNQWLEQTIRSGSSRDLKEKIKSHQENVKKAQSPLFPECRGADANMDSAMQEAVSVFMDSAHPKVGFGSSLSGSDFIDREARGILNSDSLDSSKLWEKDCQRNPLKVPALAREKAKKIILGALQGKKAHDEVKLTTILDSAGFKREQEALLTLLDAEAYPPASIQLFLRLVHLDPEELLLWSEQLSDFLRNHLQLELPPVLEGFLGIYGSGSGTDIKRIKVFGSDIRADSKIPVAPSIHHMLTTFENILQDVKQAAWPQISALADLASLIRLFRDKSITRSELDKKMNVLRMMCVSNRSMTKAVNILDELQPSLFVITITNKRYETVIPCICNLLNMGVLKRAVDDPQISLSKLSALFSFADGGDDTARRNAELLRSATIVLDLQRLHRYANDPLTQKTAIDTVRVETKAHYFRLAGGHRCAKLVGESDIESLFVEIQIQLSAAEAQKPKGKDSEESASENSEIVDLVGLVDEVHTRVRKVFDIAEYIFKALALGGYLETREQSIIEFPSQAPAQSRSMYEYFTDNYEVDHLHDIKALWHKIESPDSLLNIFMNARTRFPFISFACPLDIMKGKVRSLPHFVSCLL
jgi:hypothetical protein